MSHFQVAATEGRTSALGNGRHKQSLGVEGDGLIV